MLGPFPHLSPLSAFATAPRLPPNHTAGAGSLPFSLDGDRLDWAVRLPKGGARRVSIRRSDALRVAVPGRKVGEADREFLRSRVRCPAGA